MTAENFIQRREGIDNKPVTRSDNYKPRDLARLRKYLGSAAESLSDSELLHRGFFGQNPRTLGLRRR